MAKRKEGRERGERKKGEREGEDKGGRKDLKEPVFLPRAGPSIKSCLRLCDFQVPRRCSQGATQKQVEGS